MGFWRKLFRVSANATGDESTGGGADGAASCGARSCAEPPEAVPAFVASQAFEITEDGVNPPSGEVSELQRRFLGGLSRAREEACRIRRGVKLYSTSESIDEPLPDWYSLGMLFIEPTVGDASEMRATRDVCADAIRLLCERLSPSELTADVVLHFGNLMGIDNIFIALMRCEDHRFIEHLATRFGPDYEADGLMGAELRFLCASHMDGHLIPRTFSIGPGVAAFRSHTLVVDPNGDLSSEVNELVVGTSWQAEVGEVEPPKAAPKAGRAGWTIQDYFGEVLRVAQSTGLDAQKEYIHRLGTEIDERFGLEGMQDVCYATYHAMGDQGAISSWFNSTWDGIGQWRR